MALHLSLVTAGTDPLSVTEVETHCRLQNGEEEYALALIRAAAQYVEKFTRRQLTTATWDYFLDEFEDPIEIPKPPLISITSIKYLDADGIEQTLAATVYECDTTQDPGLVRLKYNQVWPTTRDHPKAITIRFVAGYGATPQSVPNALRQAMLLLISHWYENREAVNIGNIVNVIPMSANMLLEAYKVPTFY